MIDKSSGLLHDRLFEVLSTHWNNAVFLLTDILVVISNAFRALVHITKTRGPNIEPCRSVLAFSMPDIHILELFLQQFG